MNEVEENPAQQADAETGAYPESQNFRDTKLATALLWLGVIAFIAGVIWFCFFLDFLPMPDR